MLILHTKLTHAGRIDARLVLPYELREKCRLRARLDNGEEVGVFAVRGTVLRDGDLLTGADQRVVQVLAAPEATYRVTCGDAQALLRCAFHLGNRHTQAQLGAGFLRIRADAVLKEMLLGLGASVAEEQAPFEPEAGAYGGGHHHDSGHPGAGQRLGSARQHGEGNSHGDAGLGARGPLAPIPLRQRIHRPSDIPGQPAVPAPESTSESAP